MEIQENLDKAYYDYLKNIFQKEKVTYYIENNLLSSPQLINVSTPDGNYLYSDYRILFIGQETKGWLNPFPKDLINLSETNITQYLSKLKKLYYNFNFGNTTSGKKYNGIFKTYTNKIISNFPKNKIGFLTTNLYKHDELAERITPEKYDLIKFESQELLKTEIQILKPNLIVFFTGHALDSSIKEILNNNLEYNTIDGIDVKNKFVQIKSKDYPEIQIYRTYHPNYLKWLINKEDFVKIGIDHVVATIKSNLKTL